MISVILAAAAAFFIVLHIATLALAWRRCRPGGVPSARSLAGDVHGVTVVRPLCGLETFSDATIESSFALDYPLYEILFCVADPADAIVPFVEKAIGRHHGARARLLLGNDVISINPKLNNMVKGWREAAYPWIAFIDSNVLIPRGFVTQLVAAWDDRTGAVSAPPAGCLADGLWSHLECAFLNTYEARWQYAVDGVGLGFAQGKTLFYRKTDLDRSGMRELATEPAEDAATTKMVRRHGLRVRLAPPSPQPLGRRAFGEVWGRQLRWARLRRATFLAEFLPEIVSGSAVPVLLAGLAADRLGLPVAGVMAAYLLAWWGSEMALAAACRWPVSWQTPLALAMRDGLMPAIWIGAFTGSSFTWKGTAMTMHDRRRGDDDVPAGVQPNEGA